MVNFLKIMFKLRFFRPTILVFRQPYLPNFENIKYESNTNHKSNLLKTIFVF